MRMLIPRSPPKGTVGILLTEAPLANSYSCFFMCLLNKNVDFGKMSASKG